jgi:hypothetical protein
MSKRTRLQYFKQRAGEDVHDIGEYGRFVTVNPMSDEQALLDRLGMDPESCIKVDLYWEYAGDVVFVQVQSVFYANERSPGTYARSADDGRLNIVIVVPDRAISSDCVLEHLRRIAGTVAALERDRLGPKLIPFNP